MTEIIDLAKARKKREPHIAGVLYCQGCDHEWTATWPLGTTEFECPACKSIRGRSKFDVAPSPGSNVWSCMSCNNQLFNLLPDCVHCSGCGKQWDYGELAL